MRKLTAIIILHLVAGAAFAGGWFVGDGVYVGNVRATNDLSVTNDVYIGGDLTVNGTAAITNLNVASDLSVGDDFRVDGYSYFFNNLNIIDATIYGSSAYFTNWMRVDQGAYFYSSVDFHSGSICVFPDSSLSVEGYLYTFGTNKLTSWDRLQLNYGGETLPSYVSNVVNIATGSITAASIGALTNESDTLSTVLARGNNAAGQSATNMGSLFISGDDTVLGKNVRSRDSALEAYSGYGAAFGYQSVAGSYGFAAGDSATAGYKGFSVGSGSQSLEGGHAMGYYPRAGKYSFAFADRQTNGLGIPIPFDRSSITNGFSVRASGGVYFDTPSLVATGSITAAGGFYHGSNPVLTNPAAFWQHASTVIAPTASYSIAFSGPATWNAASNRYDILPYSTTNYGAITGAVTITMANNAYLSEVVGTWYYATVSGLTPAQPVSYDLQYISSSSAVLSAWCATNAGDAVPPYYVYFSNLVVYTFDRSMSPYQYTNDVAGIVARCDPLPAGNTDTRRVVNAASLTAAIAAAKPAIAQEAWAYMPSGARQPSLSLVTLDKPLVQQGRVNYIQSGDYFAQSYQGVWDQATTGGVWRIGPNGKTALEITSTNIWLAISAFSVRTNVASFVIETNNVAGTPYLEYCSDLVAAQWTYAAGQSVGNNTTNWTATCPVVSTMLFFRAVSLGGANTIVSHYQHQFTAGLRATSLQQTAGGWNDLNFPATTIYNVGLTDIEYYSASNGILFKNTCNTNFSSDNAWVTAQLPHSIATNSAAIYPHIHFAQDSATLTGAVFLIRYKRYAPGAAIPTTWTDLPTSNVFAYASGPIHQIADTAGISGPFALSELFDFKIWYRGATGPVVLKFFDLHYQQDGLGSSTLYTKDF